VPEPGSFFIEGLRSQLIEDSLRGRGPDREALLRRFPGHRAEVEALLAELFPNGRRAGAAEIEASVTAETQIERPSAPDEASSRTPRGPSAIGGAGRSESEIPRSDPGTAAVAAERQPEVVVEGRHGVLLRQPDGKMRCHLPADRLAAWGPASLYLARAERLSHTAVPGVQTPEILTARDGSVDVVFAESPPTVVSLAASLSRGRGATHLALGTVRRAARRLERLHAQGAAHGRLRAEHLRLDGDSGSLVLDMGLADGPGRDGDEDVAIQKLADVRALGAILYGALELSGQEPDVREILARHQEGKLPYLLSRRPRLLPAVEHLVERALSAGDWGHAGFGSINEFVASLEALLDMEGENPPSSRTSRTASSLRHREWVPYAVIGGLLILILIRVWLL
jgi:hypothetical protein